MTCSMCSRRVETKRCPHCCRVRREHAGATLDRLLSLMSGVPVRTLWEALGVSGQRLADEAMAQIRATPPREVRPIDRVVGSVERHLYAQRLAMAGEA